jgi:hypothetical protein
VIQISLGWANHAFALIALNAARFQIPAPTLKRPEELAVQELAARLGVQPGPVYYWVKRGMIQGRRINNGSPGLNHNRRHQA